MRTLEVALERPANNILVIRLVAATLVVFSHSFPLALGGGVAEPPAPVIPTSFGTIGVSVFFTISGLLISRSYVQRASLWRFLWARAVRIYPALIVAVLFCAGVIGPVFTTLTVPGYLAHPDTARFILKNATLVTSMTVQVTLPGVFGGNHLPYAVNDPLWTLPYELWMYAAVAVAGAVGALRRGPFTVLAIFLAFWMVVTSLRPDQTQALLLVRLGGFFLAGVAAYVYRSRVPLDPRLLLLAIVGATLLYFTPWFMWGFRAALVYGVLVLAFTPRVLVSALSRVGDLSYGVYIFGFPCQQAVAAAFPSFGPAALFIAAMVMTLPLAALSWRFIERPALRLKTGLRLPSPPVAAPAGRA